jgi:hypothetical protein
MRKETENEKRGDVGQEAMTAGRTNHTRFASAEGTRKATMSWNFKGKGNSGVECLEHFEAAATVDIHCPIKDQVIAAATLLADGFPNALICEISSGGHIEASGHHSYANVTVNTRAPALPGEGTAS